MFKIFGYLKKSVLPILIIIGLLIVMAICDLTLPDYTSRIINVGVQQGGIEEVVPKAILKQSLEDILLFTDSQDKNTILNHYRLVSKKTLSKEEYNKLVKKYPKLETEEIYLLNKVSKEEKNTIDEILTQPMLIYYMLTSNSEEALKIQNEIKSSFEGTMSNYSLMEIFRHLPEESLVQMREK